MREITAPYKLLLLLLIATGVTGVQAQLKVTGSIYDSLHRPVPFASISLLKEYDTPLQTVPADSTGHYLFNNLPAGRYVLTGSYGGSTISRSRPFFLQQDTAIVLLAGQAANNMLQEVTVTAKPLLERKTDRLVFNVENSLAAKGMDMQQVLAQTPLLRVTDNRISIVGKSDVSVMINNRMVHLSGADLMNYLKSLRADDIAKIEVITAPPARYEAQGNSGMVNIVLKKNPNTGWSGNVGSSYIQTTYPGINNNVSVNYQSNKISASIKARQYNRASRATERVDIIDTNSILSYDQRKDMSHGIGANVSINYKAGKKANIGVIYDVSNTGYDMNITNATQYQTYAITDSTLSTLSKQRSSTGTQTLNLYHDQQLDNKGKLLSTGINYFYTAPGNSDDFQSSSDKAAGSNSVRNTSNLHYNIWSGQQDLTLPWPWATLETGWKYTRFSNNSDVNYYTVVQDNYVQDPSKSNQFEYREKNIAGYGSLQKEFGKKWSAKAGLRYEYSSISAYSHGTNETNNTHYQKFFPSVYVTYKPTGAHTFSVNYTKRINRPGFRALNPFRWYVNPYSYYTGNPFLQPSYNHNVELSYLYNGILSVSVYAQKLINGFSRVASIANNIKVVDYRNYMTKYDAGMDITFGKTILPNWETREVFSFWCNNMRSGIAEVTNSRGAGLSYSVYNTFALTKTVNLLLNFSHLLPAVDENVHFRGTSSLSPGVKLALLQNQLQVNATVDDVYKGLAGRGYVSYAGFTQPYHNYYDSRRLTMNITWLFGNNKVKGNRKQVNFNEKQRAS